MRWRAAPLQASEDKHPPQWQEHYAEGPKLAVAIPHALQLTAEHGLREPIHPWDSMTALTNIYFDLHTLYLRQLTLTLRPSSSYLDYEQGYAVQEIGTCFE
jgi:hypothetical protein